MNTWRKLGSQNCHSYALEKYFLGIGIKSDLFNEWTVLAENKHMDMILTTSFQKIQSFNIRNKKCRDCSFSPGSIVVFRNKWNWPIHTVYFDGNFQTKNGALPAKSVDDMAEIIQTYWDTKLVEEHRLDDSKIAAFLKKRSR